MDWDAIIKAYPRQTDVILGVKSLRERIERAMADIELPALERACRDMQDLSAFAPVLAPACGRVWKDLSGSEPPFDMAAALAALTTEGDVPRLQGEDLERLQAIAQNAFSRFLELLRGRNGHLLPPAWDEGDCPFCGEYARVGFDEDDGRTLHCLTCGHAWRFPRLRCPSCGNTDHATMGYFEAEGIDGVRVYYCRECMRYLKIVDRKARPAHDAETEDALTIELDELARKEQFT